MIRILISTLILFSLNPFFAIAASIKPYISTGIVHESNLFLLANDEEAQRSINSDIRSDTVFQFTPGVKGKLEHRRQEIFFDLSLTEYRYNNFDQFDFTGGDARVNWDWLYGRRWDGRATYRFSSEQTKFDEPQSAGDSRDINLFSFTANRKLNPRYSLISGISYRTIDFDRRDTLSIDRKRFDLGLRYTSRSDNKLELVYQYEDGEYPNRNTPELERGLDTGYRDQSLLTKLYWQSTAKSLFNIEAGLTDRKQDNVSENDFDGLIGNATYQWAISEKTLLKSSIWRELRDSEDQLTNFIEVDGVGLEVEWKNTAKITSFANLELEDRDFQPNGQATNTLAKKDDYTTAEVGINYQLKENIMLTSAYRYEKRESNVELRDYKNDLFYLFMEVGF